MSVKVKVVNRVRALVQRHGSESVKKWLWDWEYGQGSWACLDVMPTDCVYAHVERFAKNGSILDLGCGPGTVGDALNAAAYRSYLGVDISAIAVEKAKNKALENGRSGQNEFLQSDIGSYVPKQQYDVIMFGDSLGYFTQQRIGEMFDRYAKHLKPGGVLIVRNWMTRDTHRALIHHIESNFKILEKHLYHEPELVVLVFLPLSRGEKPTTPAAVDHPSVALQASR